MRTVQGKLCSDGANTQSRSVGGYSWKNLPIWGKKWDFLLLVQLVLSPVCSSHVKAEGSSKSRWGEEGRALLGSGLWKQWGFMAVFVGVLCSRAVTIHGESTFLLLLESQNHSIAQVGRDPKDHGVPAPRVPDLKAWKSSLAFSLQMKVDFSIP